MARLTRKMWIGIGAATVAGAALGGHAVAQHTEHKADKGKGKSDATATKNPGDGGEAYLTDGGPRDTRIRFYRDLGLIRGHLLVGGGVGVEYLSVSHDFHDLPTGPSTVASSGVKPRLLGQAGYAF